MSQVDIKDAHGAVFKSKTHQVDDGGQPVVAQGVVLTDPSSGNPVPIASETTLQTIATALGTLNTLSNAIKTALDSLNGKTTAINTASIGGVVALDGDTLIALESISANTGLAQPLTDAQLRAAAIPVSNSWLAQTIKQKNTAGAIGDYGQIMLAQRRDSDTAETTADGQLTCFKMDQAGRLKVATQPGDVAATVGSITGSGQSVFIQTSRISNLSIAMVASSLSGHNAVFEISNDSTTGTDGNWKTVQVVRTDSNTIDTSTGALSATPVYAWELNVAAYAYFRIRATAHTAGTAAYTLKPGAYATEPVPSSQNPALVLYPYNLAGVIAINTDLIIIDCVSFKSLSIQCLAMGTTGVVTGQWSNDAAFTLPVTATLSSETGASSTTFNAACLRNTNVLARYFRLRLTTATTAGTTTINVQASQAPLVPLIPWQATQPVSGTVSITGYPTAAASADGLANPTVTKIDATTLLFNGTTWDRARGNVNTTTGDTGAKTATFNGATQTNYNARGATVLINMGTVSGTTPTLAAKLQGSADGGTTWYDIPGAVTPSITATGTTVMTIYPGATVAANAAISYPLPRTWRLAYTIGGTTPSFTITNVQVAYIN